MAERLRFGQFNIRDLTMEKLRDPGNRQAAAAAKIIKKFSPDVLSIDEMEADPGAPAAFIENFLMKGEDAADYPFFYVGQTNSGIQTGLPYPYDYKGFGRFRGQYGIALLSRQEIDYEGIINLKDFHWRSLAESYLQAAGSQSIECPEDFPLWSTAFLDIPIKIGSEGGHALHAVLLHPTVPMKDYINPWRNADQLVFLKNHIDGLAMKNGGGLPFVVMGDLNADPDSGIGIAEAAKRLFWDENIICRKTDQNTFLEGGGVEPPMEENPALLQARLDYILPSSRHFKLNGPFVFAPRGTSWWPVARRASDHFFVYADCEFI